MPSNRRTEFAPFVLDLPDFMEKKIREAIDDECSWPAAISEAAGAVPVLRDRLTKNEVAQAQFMLVFDAQMFDAERPQSGGRISPRWTATNSRSSPANLVGPKGTLAALREVAAASATIS
jgi:hypothetical protein